MMKEITKKHSIFYAIGISFLFFILESFIYSIAYVITKSEGSCYFFSYLFTLLILVIINRKSLKEDLFNLKKDIKGKIFKLLLAHFIFIVLMYISNYILYSLFDDIAKNETYIREILYKEPILMGLSIGIIGPFIEELIYRYPYKNLRTNKTITFITYTLIFALLHITVSTNIFDLLYIIPYTFLSLSIGYSFYKTNNIFTSIFFHLLNNSFTVLILFLNI